MSVVFTDDWLTVHHGDARAVLPTLEAASIEHIRIRTQRRPTIVSVPA